MRVVALALLVAGIPAAGGTPAGVNRIAWLQGCWSLTAGGRTVEEHWMSPRGGAMLGISRTVQDGRLVEYEFLIIRERGDALVYEARPSGQSPAEFVAPRIDADSVVFENAQHDFPQRVGYRPRGSGIDAWIEGTVGGQRRRVDFPYERTACPGKAEAQTRFEGDAVSGPTGG
jgi:hypothetical protein